MGIEVGEPYLQAKELYVQQAPLDSPSEETNPDDTLILDFWPLEMLENKFLLFYANRHGIIFYRSSRKLIQKASDIGWHIISAICDIKIDGKYF